ncbi:hypothetical protein F4777DRAFT_568246 [Nemania sp. FL0916]|nr:hypothetical protein F4777DRAFT_568246 [Nemania sp. FL0916]
MQLKRKRSESELSTSTTSTFNSPPRFGSFSPQSLDISSMDIDSIHFPVSPLSRFSNKNLNFAQGPGRTMKRFRDNRPSESQVHQHTLDMLYAAQRPQRATLSHETSSQMQQNIPVSTQPGTSSSLGSSHQKTNLHSFWKIPSQPSASPAPYMLPVDVEAPTECEDCGQSLCEDDSGAMMNVDAMSGTPGTGCGSCGKHVCSHCSITHLGKQRRCLGCAGAAKSAGTGAKPAWARGMTNWLC